MKWPVPGDTEMEAKVRRNDEVELPGRAERYQFIQGEFGFPPFMALNGGLTSALAINDLQRSFIHGNFLATILVAQAFIERSLACSIFAAGDDGLVGAGFARLIDGAVERDAIPSDLGARLHEMRRFRNPYAHDRPTLSENTLERRVMESETPAEDIAEADARFAVELVVDYLRLSNPEWHPGNPEAPVIVM